MGSRVASALGFRADRRGIAALEFALVFPVMLILYIGIIDVTRGVIASRKLNLLARTIADLVSQQPTSYPVAMTTMSNIFAAASAVMEPYDPAFIKLTVSGVDIRYNTTTRRCCDAVVRWSFTQSGALRKCSPPLVQVADGVYPLPTNFPVSLINANVNQGFQYQQASSFVIVADAYYTYQPFFLEAFSWFAPGLSKTSFMVPRSPDNPITIADPSSVSAPQSGVVCFQ